MFKNKILPFLVIMAATAVTSAAEKAMPAPGAELFGDSKVRTFRIEITGSEWEALQKDNRQYVRGTVREGTQTFTNVAVHLKGMGSFRPLNEKPSFAVRFDKYTPGQAYAGMTKFLLNNSSQDASYLAEYMSTSLFRDAGLPAARVTHAFVQLNGRDLGLYVLIEAMNKEFLHQHFKSARGNLYEAYTQDVDQQLDQDSGKPSQQLDRKALVDALKISDPVRRWKQLDQVLDVDEFISFLALEMFVGHRDGYANNRNNYRIYHDPYSDKFVFITHGLDWGFLTPNFPLQPPLNSLAVRAVLETPEGKARYRERLGLLFTNLFDVARLTNRVNDMAAKLHQAARSPAESAEWSNQAREMNERIVQRARNIADQLAIPEAVELVFDTNGVARIKDWRPKIDKDKTSAQLGAVSADGRSSLKIEAAPQGCVASWRSRAALPAGRFRFVGEAKGKGVTPRVSDVGAGAGLRISGSKRSARLIGDTAWQPLEFSFELPQAGEVDLVCELRAEKGEVWFDRDLFRVIRMPTLSAPASK